jgi:methionyl-tRNA synthetase
MQTNKFYVTTPIYYVNDRPHIGHAYTTILADVLARYHRLLGVPTFFLTGSDEHGQKVQQAAEKGGVTPQQHADTTVVRFQELWKKLEITNDDFIRTTEPRHKTVVQEIFQKLYEKDEIYRAEYDGWYCVPCERFFMEKDLDNGACPDCKRPVERIRESNYFLRMSKYQEWLIQYIQDHPKFIQPDFRRNETLGFLRKKLNDLCVSRPKSRLSWGIELPFDKDFVAYVWCDALTNYISAVGYLSDDAKFKKWWPASYHLIGKDILTTHTVYWPIMLKAMGVELPEAVFAHGWWLMGDSKMSKTTGNVVDPMQFVDKYGVDAFRYFLMAEMVLGQDASFTEEAFIRRYNADLANDLGNMLSRLVKMLSTYTGGLLPEPDVIGEDELTLRTAALDAAHTMETTIATMRLDLGLAAVANVVRAANRYLEIKQPWTLAKQEDKRPLHRVLYTAAETLRIVSGLLYPVMPGKMRELRVVLGIQETVPDIRSLKEWGLLKPGARLGEMQSLFPRIMPVPVVKDAAGTAATTGASHVVVTGVSPVPAPKDAAGTAATTGASHVVVTGVSPVPAPVGVALVEYADFQKIQLRTAKIVEAEKVAGADKLLKLQIEVGGEKRQLVAGIALHYEPAALIGKTVVVVANLKPATIRGVESNGMLLAASVGKELKLITVDGEFPSGAVVK